MLNTIAHPLPTPPVPKQLTAYSSPSAYWAWCFMNEKSLWPLQISCLGLLPHFLCLCSLAEHGQWRTPWLILSTTEEQQKHWYVINIIILDPKHSTKLPSMRKINSIQAKNRPALNDGCEKALLWQSTFCCLCLIKRYQQCHFSSQWHAQCSNSPNSLMALFLIHNMSKSSLYCKHLSAGFSTSGGSWWQLASLSLIQSSRWLPFFLCCMRLFMACA